MHDFEGKGAGKQPLARKEGGKAAAGTAAAASAAGGKPLLPRVVKVAAGDDCQGRSGGAALSAGRSARPHFALITPTQTRTRIPPL